MSAIEAKLRKSGMSETNPDTLLDTYTTKHNKERAAVPPKGVRKHRRNKASNDKLPLKRLKTGD